MNEREALKQKLAEILNTLKPDAADAVTPDDVTLENPPDSKMGDVGVPLFAFAKTFKQAPAKIAENLAA